MSASIDLDLLTLYRRAGQDQSAPPGLRVARKPRRPARSREADQLIIHLELTGNITLPLDLSDQILIELEKAYYETGGSVTTALRYTAEVLNQILLQRNLQSAGGNQVIGMLSLASRREGQLYLAQSGPVYACYLGANQVEELYDPQLSGRGLGINQNATLRYFYASLNPGDTLLISSKPIAGWDVQNLPAIHGQSLEFQRQQLLHQVTDLNAFLVAVKPGTGKVNLLPARPLQITPPTPGSSAGEPEQAGPQERLGFENIDQKIIDEDEFDESVREQALLDQYQPLPELGATAINGLSIAPEAVSVSPPSRAEVPPGTPPARGVSQGSTQPVKTVPAKKPGFFARLAAWLLVGLNRILPDETVLAIPNSVLAVIAIITPLVIVGFATLIYFQRGVAAQSEAIYAQAVQAVQAAQTQTDPALRREGLNNALSYLDAADAYRQLPQTGALRLQVQGALDELELIKRLNYQPALVGGLSEGAQISRIAAVEGNLFLLDRQSGSVLRASFTNQGYQIDPTFQCGPGSPTNVGPLIDMSGWTIGGASDNGIVAMDEKGILVFCGVNSPARLQTLANPPDKEFSSLKGFAFDQTDLYILDPASDAVWVYWSGDFEGEPTYYFDEQAPPLEDVVDIEAINEELYLLHQDGHMTVCQTGSLGEITPNRCTDPVPYVDMRPGREGAALNVTPSYSQIEISPPPDPSLYLLNAPNQAVDRYSLRNLAFQNSLQPIQEVASGAASAFTVDPVDRIAYLAIGNRIYYASIP